MNVLFISEPYIERLLLCYFIHEEKHKFIMLKANHPEIQRRAQNNLRFLDLSEAILECDCIYILYAEKVPTSIIAICETIACDRKIPLFCSNSSETTGNLENYLDNILNSTACNLPTILILQEGTTAQIEKTELNLCFSLQNNNIRYNLHFNSCVQEVNKMSIALDTTRICSSANDAQISVITIKENIFNLIKNNSECLFFERFCRMIQADYIIMCCENDYNYLEEVNDIFKKKYSRTIDKFVQSEYVTLLHQNRGETKKSVLFIENVKHEDLFYDVKMKLTFPTQVMEIRFTE